MESTNPSQAECTRPGWQSNSFWNKKFRKVLKIRDADGDGKITLHDFKLIAQRFKDMGATENSLQKMKKSSTKLCEIWGIVDESSALSYEEFTKAFIAMLENVDFKYSNQFFCDMFDVIDTNSNNLISFEEWSTYNKAIGVTVPAHSKASFKAMDANGDGVVSREEFLAYNKEFFYSTEDKLKSSILFGPLRIETQV